MRIFSRLTRLIAFTLIPLTLNLTPSVSSAAEVRQLSDVEQQIKNTAAQLTALEHEIADGKALKSDLQTLLQAAQERVGEREQRLQALASDIARYDKKLNRLDTLVAEARRGVDDRREILARALRDAQQIGQQSALKILLQNDDPAMADRLSVYTDYLFKAQNQAVKEQAHALQRIQAAYADAAKDRNWLNHIQNKAAKQKAQFADNASNNRRKLGEVETTLSQKTRTVAQLKADQSRLQSLFQELKSTQNGQSGYFASGKGEYPAPVTGELIARFGDIKSVGKLRWKGLFIAASEGQAVRSVADGEVVYSDFLQGFGMLVIVDHGDSYTSLYAGNRDVTVPAGQWVESGATIATVGDSGGQNSSGVYFEIRHEADAVDPEDWLKPDFQIAKRQ